MTAETQPSNKTSQPVSAPEAIPPKEDRIELDEAITEGLEQQADVTRRALIGRVVLWIRKRSSS